MRSCVFPEHGDHVQLQVCVCVKFITAQRLTEGPRLFCTYLGLRQTISQHDLNVTRKLVKQFNKDISRHLQITVHQNKDIFKLHRLFLVIQKRTNQSFFSLECSRLDKSKNKSMFYYFDQEQIKSNLSKKTYQSELMTMIPKTINKSRLIILNIVCKYLYWLFVVMFL